MKVKYISNTPESPKFTKVFGYDFQLDGEAIEIKEKEIINKFKGMAHAGFIIEGKIEEELKEVVEEKVEEKSESKKGGLKEYSELKKFISDNNIQVADSKKETLLKAKEEFLNGSN